MSKKTSLFALLRDKRVVVFIDGFEIDKIDDVGVDTCGKPVLRCSVDDLDEYHFVDQEVVLEDGDCKLNTAKGDWPEPPTPVLLCFRQLRPFEPPAEPAGTASSGAQSRTLAPEHYYMIFNVISAFFSLIEKGRRPAQWAGGQLECVELCGDIAIQAENLLGGRLDHEAFKEPWCYGIHDDSSEIRALYRTLVEIATGLGSAHGENEPKGERIATDRTALLEAAVDRYIDARGYARAASPATVTEGAS